jgi:hypothetical protein
MRAILSSGSQKNSLPFKIGQESFSFRKPGELSLQEARTKTSILKPWELSSLHAARRAVLP